MLSRDLVEVRKPRDGLEMFYQVALATSTHAQLYEKLTHVSTVASVTVAKIVDAWIFP